MVRCRACFVQMTGESNIFSVRWSCFCIVASHRGDCPSIPSLDRDEDLRSVLTGFIRVDGQEAMTICWFVSSLGRAALRSLRPRTHSCSERDTRIRSRYAA